MRDASSEHTKPGPISKSHAYAPVFLDIICSANTKIFHGTLSTHYSLNLALVVRLKPQW